MHTIEHTAARRIAGALLGLCLVGLFAGAWGCGRQDAAPTAAAPSAPAPNPPPAPPLAAAHAPAPPAAVPTPEAVSQRAVVVTLPPPRNAQAALDQALESLASQPRVAQSRIAAQPDPAPSDAPPDGPPPSNPPSPEEIVAAQPLAPPPARVAPPEALALAAPAPPVAPDPTNEFFDQGRIPELRFTIAKDQMDKLRANQRQYVECTFTEDGKTTYKGRLKLKGAAGSFRGVDDRPALTINVKAKKDAPGARRFHGLDKFHLNNSVQDESYLSELICAQVCRAAGYPAARATHARVWLNDRDLGFYGLKEGFDEHFLARNFPGSQGKGNLYDGGFCQEIDGNLERDEGEGPDDKADLKALVAACREPDPAKRAALVAERLDVDAFLTYTALELMMSHWDGYAQNRNNYRVYFRPQDGRAVFFPHGMDQMFGDPNFSVYHVPGALVSNVVLQNPEWRARYQQRVKSLLPLFAPEKLHALVDAAHARIRPVVAAIHADRARHLDDRVRDFRARLNDRQKNILAQAPPEPIAFNPQGWALVENWTPMPAGDVKAERREIDGRTCLVLETGPSRQCAASFRSKVTLGPGVYRFEARVKTDGVVPLAEAAKVGGAGLRLSGGVRENSLAGTANWTTLAHPIEVAEALRAVELVAELRSTAGAAYFDLASLRIVRVK